MTTPRERRLAVLTLFVFGVYLCGRFTPWSATSGAPRADWRPGRTQQAAPALVYLLDAERWTDFDLPPAQDAVRLVTNGNLRWAPALGAAPPPPETEWTYAVRYQLLDAAGKTLLESEHHVRSRLSNFSDGKSSDTWTAAFYLGEPETPTNTKVILLNLGGLPAPVARLRLRLARKDDVLAGAVGRVYVRRQLADYKQRFVWERLSAEQREMIARGNVYGPDLLREAERRNLLEVQWDALGPMGVEGREYVRRALYVLKEVQGEEVVREEVVPAGLFVDAYRQGVVPVPEGEGRARLSFRPLPRVGPGPGLGAAASGRASAGNAASGNGSEPRILVRWYGEGITERATSEVAWAGRSAELETRVDGGVLEIVAPGELVVHATWTPAPGVAPPQRPEAGGAAAGAAGASGGEAGGASTGIECRDITPVPSYLRAYRVTAEGPIEFRVLHDGESHTPFRVELRPSWPGTAAATPLGPAAGAPAPAPGGAETPGFDASYELLDEAGKPVARGQLRVAERRSAYDSFADAAGGEVLGDPATGHFALPPAVARVRLTTSATPVLVTAFTRPAGMVRELRVPEGYADIDRTELDQPGWFPLLAEGDEALDAAGRAPALVVSARPPVDDPEVFAGRFLWEDFRPQGAWHGRYVLAPRARKGLNVEQAAPVAFRPLVPGLEEELVFISPDGQREVVPSLAVLRDEGEEPLSVGLYVDGSLLATVAAGAGAGATRLPPLSIGPHRVRAVLTGAARLFLNFVEPGDAPGLLQTLANRLDGGGPAFVYEKETSERELLTLRLFQPRAGAGRSRVRVYVGAPGRGRPVGPSEFWTFADWRFDVRPAVGAPAYLLGTSGELVDGGRLLFVPLGDDLPPGSYPIRVEAEGGSGGYVVFSRIRPGLREQREFFTERGPTMASDAGRPPGGAGAAGAGKGVARPSAPPGGAPAAPPAGQPATPPVAEPATPPGLGAASQDALVSLWRAAARGGHAGAVSGEEVAVAETLFVRALTPDPAVEELATAWAAVGMEFFLTKDGDAEFLVLREPQGRKLGRGFYAFRRGASEPVAWEAPHGDTDLHTGVIVARALREGRARAAAWNTVPRGEVDLAHTDATLFQAFTRAFGRTQPEGVLVQLHGFETGNRKSVSAAEATMILSCGTKSPPAWLVGFADDLRRRPLGVVKLYGRDVFDLGATRNAQAEALRQLHHEGFVHIEVCEPLREELRDHAATRGSLVEAVQAVRRGAGGK
ncbi:MAG: hypothetical protein HYZ53_06270 [Planctomycetes bacterium]|nr:hypothetical protein [Planctomycetota bacterium]